MCLPTASILFLCSLDTIFRKWTIYVYCTGYLILIYCTYDCFCFLLQYPSDCIPSSTRMATLPPVRLLWASDWGAAQTTSPGPLWDRRQPRGCQSSNWWPPCGSGMDLNYFYFIYLLLGDLLLLNHCLWLVRLRSVTQSLTPLRDGAFKIESVSETNQLLRCQRRKPSWAG